MRLTNRLYRLDSVIVTGVACIIAILAAIAWHAYQYHRYGITEYGSSGAANTAQTARQQQSPSTTQAQQPAASYLDIKEWKVRLALDSNNASLYYYINPDLPNVAYLSLKTVSDIAPDCAADKGSLGAIFRETPAEYQNAVDNPSSLNQAGTLHVGDYWYGYAKPNAGCIDSAATLQAVTKAQPSINPSSAFKTLEVEQ